MENLVPYLTLVGANFIIAVVIMLAAWGIYRLTGNAGIVDIGWTSVFLFSAFAALYYGEGLWLTKLGIIIMTGVWSARLIGYLILRYWRNEEDPRYTKMREDWGGDPSGSKFLTMFVFQGVLATLLTLPLILAANDYLSPVWSYWHIAGAFVWLIGILGEGIADQQLQSFKEVSDKGQVCRVGLWKYSRHPNYFFEWVIWLGFTLYALSGPGGTVALIAPVIMLGLLLKVSGVPVAEEQSLETKGEAYKEYQETTSSFIPLPPKDNSK